MLPAAFEGIREQRDKGKVAARRQEQLSRMGGDDIIIDGQPITGSHCKSFDAANSDRRGQASQARCRIDAGNTWYATQAPNEGIADSEPVIASSRQISSIQRSSRFAAGPTPTIDVRRRS
jgi:hypothetical protein